MALRFRLETVDGRPAEPAEMTSAVQNMRPIFAWIGGASALGVAAGRYLRRHSDVYREPIGALQGALLGVIGLVLAFALTLAVERYQDRRTDVVDEANTIGTA